MTERESYEAFLPHPVLPRHRRYEMLRARFVEHRSAKEIAARLDVSASTVASQIRDFKRAWKSGTPMAFFLEPSPGPKTERKKPLIREHVVRLRARGYPSRRQHVDARC